MGINISGTNFVTLDHTHQRRVDTSIENNPTRDNIGDLVAYHIFRRNKDGDPDRDGNPLVKAMKGMGGYRVIPLYRDQVMTRAREVLMKFSGQLEVDMVMPMPSSYGLSQEVAELVCQVTGREYLSPSFIRKRTIAEMLAEYDGNVPDHLNSRLTKFYKDQLYTWKRMKPGQYVSMKEIETKIRTCFQPLVLGGHNVPNIEGSRVLVVDDLMASGSSLASVSSVLVNGTGCSVPFAVCFLSSL